MIDFYNCFLQWDLSGLKPETVWWQKANKLARLATVYRGNILNTTTSSWPGEAEMTQLNDKDEYLNSVNC